MYSGYTYLEILSRMMINVFGKTDENSIHSKQHRKEEFHYKTGGGWLIKTKWNL
jgi:hypothetical protein